MHPLYKYRETAEPKELPFSRKNKYNGLVYVFSRKKVETAPPLRHPKNFFSSFKHEIGIETA